MRNLGTVVSEIRTPIIKENDNLESIVVDSVINASKNNNFEFNDRDVIAITEAVVSYIIVAESNFEWANYQGDTCLLDKFYSNVFLIRGRDYIS